MTGLLGWLVTGEGGEVGGYAAGLLVRSLRGKWLAGSASLLAVGAVLWPIVENWREHPRDGFPLSYYPMFTAKRSETVSVTYLVGLDPQGGRHQIPYAYAGSGGLNQVRRQINRALREGRAEALCRNVAAKIALEGRGPLADVIGVRIVVGKYRLADYFAGEGGPNSEHVRASCEVGRDAP